jgi:hypothetical protein
MSRHSKLANHEHVHRSAKRLRHFDGDRYTSTGKGQHHQVGVAGELLQLTGENGSCVPSIGKR